MHMDRSARDAARERLAAFVGEWDVEATFPGAPPAGAIRTVFEWTLGGAVLMQRTEIPEPPEAPDNLLLYEPDADGDAYVQHYFDSRGIARVYAMTLADGVWTLRRDAPDFTPLDFAQRFEGRFGEAGSTIRGRWELSHDGGATWEHDFDLTYTKVA
jgi:hypothetical protein